MSFKVKDHFYKKAKKEKFLARSIYKLEEIDKKHKLIKKDDRVLDLGYYPGSWIQYISKAVGPKGLVYGMDIQPINEKLKLPNITLLELDFREFDVDHFDFTSELFDVVTSDMAPKTTGMKDVDQARSMELVENIFARLPKLLLPNGNLVVKVFESGESQRFFQKNRILFKETSFLRPKSTRSTSKEYFFIGKAYQPS